MSLVSVGRLGTSAPWSTLPSNSSLAERSPDDFDFLEEAGNELATMDGDCEALGGELGRLCPFLLWFEYDVLELALRCCCACSCRCCPCPNFFHHRWRAGFSAFIDGAADTCDCSLRVDIEKDLETPELSPLTALGRRSLSSSNRSSIVLRSSAGG